MKLLSRPRASAADCVADLEAAKYGIDLSAAVIAKFNAVSEREGFPEKLDPDGMDAVANRRHGLVEAMLDALDEAGVS